MQKSDLILILFLLNLLSACLYSSLTVTCGCFCHNTVEFIKRQVIKRKGSPPLERVGGDMHSYALWGSRGKRVMGEVLLSCLLCRDTMALRAHVMRERQGINLNK